MSNTIKKTAQKTKLSKRAKVARAFFEPTAKIIKLCKGNPRREGSWGHQSLGIVRSGMTVAQFVSKGGRLRDLHWDAQRGNVKIAA